MGNPRSVPVQILQIIINLNYSPGLGFPNPVNEIAAKTENKTQNLIRFYDCLLRGVA